jgi:multiple sugar transport system permease protein
VATVPATAARVRGRRLRRTEWPWVLLFLGPNLFLFCTFTLFPVAYGFFLSFQKWNVIEPMQFIGLANYQRFFFEDKLTGAVVANTLYYAIAAMPAQIALALFFAILLNQGIRLLGLWRGVFYLPMVTSAVAIGLIWKWLYAKQFGAFNALTGLAGIPRKDWLFDENLVIPALVVTAIWTALPLKIIFFLAALQGVPPEIYEAASIDGANRWEKFWHVTWPLISPTTFFLCIIGIIGLLVGGFDLIWTMTKGGPLDASTTIVIHIFRNAFVYYDMGYASAMAYMLFLVILALTIIQWRLQKRWVHYS